jgi:Tol biopolymer transport system component
MQLSPDDGRVVFSAAADEPGDDIWVYDMIRDVRLRLTTDPAVDHNPVWSPDGSRLAFDSHRDGGIAIYEKPSSGAVPEHLILAPESGLQQAPRDWSSDDRFILFQRARAATWDIWTLPLFGDRKPVPYIVSAFNKTNPSF